jgi:predicted ATPase
MATAETKVAESDSDERTKPPFLRRVRIRGYKSIAFCDVELQPLTILVGRNASGKSNFLDALEFLRDIARAGVSEAVKLHGGVEAIRCQWRDDRLTFIEIECGYTTSGDKEFWNATYSIEIEFPKKRPAKIRHEELRIEQGQWWVGYTNDNGRVTCAAADDEAQQRVWKVKDRPFFDVYADTPVPEFVECLETLSGYNLHPDLIRRVQKPTPGRFLERDGSNLASVIETTQENDSEVIDRISRYFAAITESVEFAGVAKYGEYETVRLRVPGTIDGQPLEFDAASMSDGTLRALAVLIAAFQIVLPYGHPSLVAIEEPETSLHPAAVRALVEALDEATQHTQILLTTHSADMLSSTDIQPSQVLVVRSQGGVTEIAPVDGASMEIIRRELDSLPDLQRQDQLAPDPADLDRQHELQRVAANGTVG